MRLQGGWHGDEEPVSDNKIVANMKTGTNVLRSRRDHGREHREIVMKEKEKRGRGGEQKSLSSLHHKL